MTEQASKTRLAEQLLFELAAALRSVPFDARGSHAHLRALELKREVRTWEAHAPDPARVDAVLDEIRRLAAAVRADRESAPPPSAAA